MTGTDVFIGGSPEHMAKNSGWNTGKEAAQGQADGMRPKAHDTGKAPMPDAPAARPMTEDGANAGGTTDATRQKRGKGRANGTSPLSGLGKRMGDTFVGFGSQVTKVLSRVRDKAAGNSGSGVPDEMATDSQTEEQAGRPKRQARLPKFGKGRKTRQDDMGAETPQPSDVSVTTRLPSRIDVRSRKAATVGNATGNASDDRLVESFDGGRDAKREARYSITKEGGKAAKGFRDSVTKTRDDDAIPLPLKLLRYVGALLLLMAKLIYVFFRGIWRFFVYLAVMVGAMGVIALLGVGYLYATTVGDLPQLQDYNLISMPQDSTIYDRDGEVIGVISTSQRTPVSFSEISQSMKDAIVSIEDERFYNHEGVDLMGIARALKVNVESYLGGGSSTSQGASTITQQYVRNAYAGVGTEQTISRKLTEMMLAVELEATASKDDILSSYLNTVYYGNGCYGVEAASQYYFGHSAKTLSPYESAILASTVNSPVLYNPTTDEGKQNTASRVNLVLDKMYSLGKLGDMTQDQLRDLKKTDINTVLHITEKKQRVINQPFYYDYVMTELQKSYTVEQISSGGWQIYTTLSIKDGQAAENVVRGLEAKYGSAGVTAAIADVNVEDGSVNAFCGGTDYATSQYNTATMGRPQSGSTLKPFLYATLLQDDGYYTTDQFDHSNVNVAGEDEKEHVITSYIGRGDGSIKNGIIQSDNAMAIHAAQKVGMDKVDALMKASGFTHDLEQNDIAIIGGQSQGFTPLEMATGYGTLANKGIKRDTWCVKTISDSLGNEIYKHEDKTSQAMDKEVALQITDAMESAVNERTNWYDIPFDRNGGWNIAAKSGTTDEKSDLWCAGFDNDHAVTVWIGGKDARVAVPTTTPTACRAFSDYMYGAHQSDSKDEFEKPQFKTTVPGIADGQSVEDWTAMVEQKQLVPKVSYVAPDSKHKEGDVIGVENEGQLVDRKSGVTIQIARDKVTVPDFTKVSPSDVYSVSDGLAVSFTTQYVSSGNSDPTITAQTVPAGSVVDKGTQITLILQILTPNLDTSSDQVPYKGSDTAMSQLEAERDALKKENDDLKANANEGANESADGNDSNGNTNGNTNAGDSNVRITVPDVTGMTVGQARTRLEGLGFDVRVSGASSSSDYVAYTNPSAGSSAAYGSTINVTATSTKPSNSNSSSSVRTQR